jgi:methionine-rich copper-binding protein CopC
MDAKLRGKHVIAASGRIAGSGNTTPPLCALGLKINKGDGFIYLWFLKGRFSGGNVVAQTKAENATINMREYTFTAMETEKKFSYTDSISGAVKSTGLTWFKGDTTQAGFDPTGWFTQVQTPDTTGAPTALALVSSDPTDEDADVAIDASIVLTFNNAVSDSVLALLDSDIAPVAVTKSLNAAKTVLTGTPTAALDATATYTLVLAQITDVYGQTIENTVITFTTAGGG